MCDILKPRYQIETRHKSKIKIAPYYKKKLEKTAHNTFFFSYWKYEKYDK